MRLRAALVAGLAVSAGLTATVAYDSPTCFWGRPTDPNVINIAYPDKGATYWAARSLTVPPGAEIVLHGTYPHARYMSFNVYDQEAAPADALADVEIAPDVGSTNPFEEGADRAATPRAYTVRIVPGPKPAGGRAPNTIYLSLAGEGSPLSPIMLYRVYVSDIGRDLTGDAGLPSAELRLPDGVVVDLTARCNPADATRPAGSELGGVPLQPLFADGAAPGTPVTYPAHDPLVWEKFFNLPHVQAATYTSGTPLRPVVDEALGEERGGYLSNAHNAYVVTLANRGFGPVLVLTGRAPAVPHTRSGETTMGPGQLRYWSVCSNERQSTRWVDCALDEEVPLDAEGLYTIVLSSAADRPCDAALSGKAWLKWGTSPETLLILRHMLPDAGFEQAVQRIDEPGEAAAVMGDYLPSGVYTTKTALESGVC